MIHARDIMRYEIKSFYSHTQGQPGNPQTAEEKATDWLNEITKKNGRPVAIATSPTDLTQTPHASGQTTVSVSRNSITIIAVFD